MLLFLIKLADEESTHMKQIMSDAAYLSVFDAIRAMVNAILGFAAL